jgi:endonuclease/exonuclease/phosphatase family metal-dependent hydrolase
MRLRPLFASIETSAPRLLGAVFFLTALLVTSSCGEKNGTPDWDTPGGKAPESSTAVPAPPAPPAPELVAVATAPTPTPPPAPAAPAAPDAVSTAGLRFINYNVENWLTMDRYVDRKNLKDSPKPEKEKQAVISLLVRHTPDVIGLCEIGEAADLAEIQQDLKQAGLDLPHLHYTGGSDPTRHLGILSRFPITSTAKPAVSDYQLDGKTFEINRGILDATIEAHGKSYRFLGAHFKSKRETEQGDQQAMRTHEARLLRRHLDTILSQDPDARVVVYGDFNDTRSTPAIKALTGRYNDPSYLTAIPAKDSRGHAWTHHWAINDIYSRIDFTMVTRGMKPDVDFQAAKIIDDEDWSEASDHRPILAIFR